MKKGSKMTEEQRRRLSEAHIGKTSPRKGIKAPIQERFNEMWIPEVWSGCWLWIGATTKVGYGKLTKVNENRTVSAHRLSWMLHKGEIPARTCVLHHCDTRSCVNPDHLFLGTNYDNDQDAMKKGRKAKGETHGMSKLTRDQVIAIRASSRPYKLGRNLGVTDHTTWCLLHKMTWKHI